MNNFNVYKTNLINENKKLQDELNKYKKENEQLKNKITKLTDDNNKLINDINKLNKNNSHNEKNQQENNDMIKHLNELIMIKDKEINDLKLQLKNNSKNDKLFKLDDILFVHFISSDQEINCPIKCLKTDTFAEVEEKLYQKYEEYRETNNNFIAKGKLVLRFKTISDNNIQDGDKIQLLNIE